MAVDLLTQAFGDQLRAMQVVDAGGEHAELVAAQPRKHVAIAQLVAHQDRQLGQQLVAGDMA